MNRRTELIKWLLEEELTEQEQKEIDLIYSEQDQMITESENNFRTVSVNDIIEAETEVGGSLET
jgi:hypothetical protein